MSVYCSHCGTENRDGAKFCTSCRKPLEQESLMSGVSGNVDQQIGLPAGSLVLGIICLIYLINPGAGVIELIPDNLPIIGNIDEGVATAGLLMALSNMGLIDLRNGRLHYQGWQQFISELRKRGQN